MRVIQTLSVSDSGDEREEEKMKLEQQFRESDEKLDRMILQRQKELTKVMQKYAAVSNRMTTSRAKLRAVKDSLIACKELLHYKRDELKRLWLDRVEHRHVLELLEQIEELKDCPDKIVSLLSQKKYLEATQALTRSMDHLNGNLKGVEGLTEVKDVLETQRENLYSTLLEDLTQQLYTESTWEVLQLRRQQEHNPFQRAGSGHQGGGSRGSKRDSQLNNNASGSGRKRTDYSSRPGSGRKQQPNLGEHIRARRLLLKDHHHASHPDVPMKMLTLAQEEELLQIIKNPKLANLTEGPAHIIVIDIGNIIIS